MQIKMIQDKTLDEIAVEIRYPQMVPDVIKIEEFLKALGEMLVVSGNGRTYRMLN